MTDYQIVVLATGCFFAGCTTVMIVSVGLSISSLFLIFVSFFVH